MLKNKAILAILALVLPLGLALPVLAGSPDIVPPTTTMVISPVAPTGINDWYIAPGPVSVSFSANDNGGGSIAETHVEINQNPTWSGDCSSVSFFGGGSVFLDGNDGTSDNGLNYVHYCSIDDSGNLETVHNDLVKVDLYPPATHVNAPATATNATFQIPVAITETNTEAGINDITLFVRKDGGSWNPDGTAAFDTDHFAFTPSGDGTYDFYSIASDGAGNNEAKAPTVESTTVVSTTPGGDITPPTTTLLVDPVDGNNGWYKSQPIIAFSVSDPDSNSANATTLYCFDGNLTCVPNTIYTGPFQLPNGVHYVQFWSEDESTNTEAVKQYDLNPIKVDEAAPSGQSVQLDNGSALNVTGNVGVTFSQGVDEPAGDNSSISSCELSTNGGTAWTDVTSQTSFALNSLTNGLVGVLYHCTDEAGNVSPDVSASITVSLPSASSPTEPAQLSGGGGGSSGGSGGFIISPTNPPGGQVLGAFAINPQILEEFFALLLGRRPVHISPSPKVLGASTVNPMIIILESIAQLIRNH